MPPRSLILLHSQELLDAFHYGVTRRAPLHDLPKLESENSESMLTHNDFFLEVQIQADISTKEEFVQGALCLANDRFPTKLIWPDDTRMAR